MNKKFLWVISIGIVILLSGYFLLTGSTTENVKITTSVVRGPFEILVYSSGQLEAQNSEDIIVPDNLRDRDIRIYEIKITDLVEEGTVVDSGDYVATLDQKAIEEALTLAREELEQAYNEFEDAKLDSNLTLSNVRDQIINAREDVEEKQIVLEESAFESPAVIRKAEMDLDKAKRKLEQEIQGYDLKKRQAVSKVERKKIELRQLENRVSKLNEVYHSLVISAPKAGMVIYGKDRTREKIKVGSTVSPWMPVIATLPDLSSMLSLTYVNEIDISRVQIGQKVKLGIDALPGVILEGEVVSKANIGQPMPKSDAKVFEVKIRVFGNVENLKPAMTTSNLIQAGFYTDTLYVPSEAVFSNDSMQFVYLEKGTVIKQVVDLGEQNENYFLIKKGLDEGDVVLLTEPENPTALSIEGMDIYYEIRERKIREEEEARKKMEEDRTQPFKLQKKSGGNSGNVIIIG
jgi:HlyD family secretion protein